MRPGPNPKRSRGRNGRRPGGGGGGGGGGGNVPSRNQTFDSNGPEVRIRGNAYQVHEKYLALARDAQSAGDRIMAENYLQHAEHYYRIIAAMNEQAGDRRNFRQEGNAPMNGNGGPPQQQEGSRGQNGANGRHEPQANGAQGMAEDQDDDDEGGGEEPREPYNM
jgi:hypothetical protein